MKNQLIKLFKECVKTDTGWRNENTTPLMITDAHITCPEVVWEKIHENTQLFLKELGGEHPDSKNGFGWVQTQTTSHIYFRDFALGTFTGRMVYEYGNKSPFNFFQWIIGQSNQLPPPSPNVTFYYFIGIDAELIFITKELYLELTQLRKDNYLKKYENVNYTDFEEDDEEEEDEGIERYKKTHSHLLKF